MGIIRKLPPSALEILNILSKNNSLPIEDIYKMLNNQDAVSMKSCRYSIRRLLENGLIKRIPNLLDMRSVEYSLAQLNELNDVLDKFSDTISAQIISAMQADVSAN